MVGYVDRQEKLVQLNALRLTPQKQLETILVHLKEANKTVYQADLEGYLKSADGLLWLAGIREANQPKLWKRI